MQSFWQKLEQFSCKVTPAALTSFLVLLASIPLHIPGINQIMPLFVLINIYYWGVYYPGVMPYGFLFVLGLLQDTLERLPLGVSSFVYMAFAFLLVLQRRVFGKMIFSTVWLGFITLSLIAVILMWAILSIYTLRWLPLAPPLLQWLMTCLSYPLIHMLLTRIYQRIHIS
jgi:rod shape-determining protein MreD